MLTVWVAVDDSGRHNGCLKVIRGSNHIGPQRPPRPRCDVV